MKALSVEEKAKAYDETIEKLRNFYRDYDTISRLINVKEELANLFSELKESEDERMRNVAINACKYMIDNFENSTKQYEDAIAWLEKQGEQKPTTIQIGRNYKCIVPPRYTCFKTGFVYKPCDEFLCGLMNFCSDCFEPIEGEQKSADNVKPKFNVGDWVVVDDGRIGRIVECTKDFVFTDLEFSCLSIRTREDKIRPWTIQDAKDGDVLSDGCTLFIFKEVLSDGSVMTYCDYYKVFTNVPMNLICSQVHPATKEQRDTLERAMAANGYRWDAEKRELIKVGQEDLTAFEMLLYDRIREYDIELFSDKEILEYSKGVAKELLDIARNIVAKEAIDKFRTATGQNLNERNK